MRIPSCRVPGARAREHHQSIITFWLLIAPEVTLVPLSFKVM